MAYSIEKHSPFSGFYSIALGNLWLVALIGLLLRFKMVASLPWVNHKYFLHGHSHFAFAGWISLVLMAAFSERVVAFHPHLLPKLKRLLIWHLLTAYGMLLSFPVTGYAPASIFFSTGTIAVSYWFCMVVWPYCTRETWNNRAAAWAAKAGLLYLVISSLGAFSLAALMAFKAASQPLYFSALYFFLHFQYNGWFFFGITALLLLLSPAMHLPERKKLLQGVQWLGITCTPAVILSGLWMKLPGWVTLIAVPVGLAQMVALWIARKPLRLMIRHIATTFPPVEKWLLALSAAAFLLRIVLQALSTIPALSRFAFGYRPVVIGYLHLILLGCISLFLLAWLFRKGIFGKWIPIARTGLIVFITGIIATEVILMIQGFGYIGWVAIPLLPELLFGAAIFLFAGTGMLAFSACVPKKNTRPPGD